MKNSLTFILLLSTLTLAFNPSSNAFISAISISDTTKNALKATGYATFSYILGKRSYKVWKNFGREANIDEVLYVYVGLPIAIGSALASTYYGSKTITHNDICNTISTMHTNLAAKINPN